MNTRSGEALARYARACIGERLGGPVAVRPRLEGGDQPGATFVTLHRGPELHGCIGSLEPRRPLVEDVRENALAAAFRDPRNGRLSLEDLPELEVEVSVLSALSPIPFGSEAEAAAALRPFEDGVVLRWGRFRGTFLPQVWEALPQPAAFLCQLKRKAGLSSSFWSDDVVLERYGVEKFKDPATLATS